MKKILALILSLCLCISSVAVFAEDSAVTAKLEASAESVSVGDVVTVNVKISGNTTKKLTDYDLAVFYDSTVLEYAAEEPVSLNAELSALGMSPIYTKAEDSVVRYAVAFTPETLEKMPAGVPEEVVLCTLKFKAIAEGEAKISFAVEGSTPKFSASLPEGLLLFTDNPTVEAKTVFENTSVKVGEGTSSSKMIVEILGVDDVKVPLGTEVDEVLAQLPETVKVKLDDGSEGTVKISWTAGSLVSGFDKDTEGEYFFTGTIDEGEYVNYNKLFSMVKVIVGEPVPQKTEILMVIGSNFPTVNGVETEIDVPAQIIDGRTLTPSRFVAEALGADVDWNDETKTVVITNGSKTVELVIDSNIAKIDGVETEIDVPAQIIDGRTLTPSRFVAEALGADVDWDDETKTVTIIG